jgi:hypothetical protein
MAALQLWCCGGGVVVTGQQPVGGFLDIALLKCCVCHCIVLFATAVHQQ